VFMTCSTEVHTQSVHDKQLSACWALAKTFFNNARTCKTSRHCLFGNSGQCAHLCLDFDVNQRLQPANFHVHQFLL